MKHFRIMTMQSTIRSLFLSICYIIFYFVSSFLQQRYLPMEQDLCQPSEPTNTDIIDIRSNVNKDNVLSLPSTGYVLAPVAKPSTNGYVQAPLAKVFTNIIPVEKPLHFNFSFSKQPAVTSNYIQPSAFTGINNPSLSKTSIIVSTTDADGISGKNQFSRMHFSI